MLLCESVFIALKNKEQGKGGKVNVKIVWVFFFSCNKCLFECAHKKSSVGQAQAKICFQQVSPRAEDSPA